MAGPGRVGLGAGGLGGAGDGTGGFGGATGASGRPGSRTGALSASRVASSGMGIPPTYLVANAA